jgi:DNA-binding transcriptional LysR family regulator
MDLRLLNYFVILSEELHFARAAERLHISQPPLTRAIQQFERELGVQLFERSKKTVLLTHAGAELLKDAKVLLQQTDTIANKVKQFGGTNAGVIKVGYVGAVMHCALPEALASFSKKYPDIKLYFKENANIDMLHGVSNGLLDIAFIRTWLNPENLHQELLLEDPFIVAMSSNHKLAKKHKIKPKELAEESFIIFLRECGPTIFDNTLAICKNAGFVPNIAHESTQLNSILRLVESGYGIALLPKNIDNGYSLNIKYCALESVKEKVPLLMITRKSTPSKALGLLKQHLKSTL